MFMKYPELVRLDKRPEILRVKEVVATEKLHGTNFRLHFPAGMTSIEEVQYGGRNEELGTTGGSFYGGRPAKFFKERPELLTTMIETFASYAFSDVLAEMKVSMDDRWQGAARTLGYDENFLALLDRERKYTAAQREWEQLQNWKATRNPKRAELEAKHGYDVKHAMHLVRLLRMCREILTTGEVIVQRPDREELLAIRNGAWSYDKLVGWAEDEDRALEALYVSSTLPKVPDRGALDRLCVELVEESLG